MYALYNVSDLPNLEFNHRKYCDIHKIEYNKIIVSDSLSEKYARILQLMQQNIGQTIFFIDNFSYFNKFSFFPELTNDLIIQRHGANIVDNFFIVKSTLLTIKIFENALQSINKHGFKERYWKQISWFHIGIPHDVCFQYPLKQNDTYISVMSVLHEDSFLIPNALVINFRNEHHEQEGNYFAEASCNVNFKEKLTIPEEEYECFNPENDIALVTMYTPSISEYGIIAEQNFKKYCKKNNITLHVYRNVPADLKENNIFDAWCKPWLLLKHYDKHKYVIWIDSDILFGEDYKIKLDDICVFKDPYFVFNSGYMLFKTNNKNKELLNDVIESIKKIEGPLNGVYNHGGDQPRFIESVKKFYPGYSPLSNMLGNTHPCYPVSISPHNKNIMLHFMGYKSSFRTAIMKAYSSHLTIKGDQ